MSETKQQRWWKRISDGFICRTDGYVAYSGAWQEVANANGDPLTAAPKRYRHKNYPNTLSEADRLELIQERGYAPESFQLVQPPDQRDATIAALRAEVKASDRLTRQHQTALDAAQQQIAALQALVKHLETPPTTEK